MSAALSMLRRAAHDVGKYVARTARNLPEGPIPPALHAMLVADLYGGPNEARPSARLDALAAGVDDPAIQATREHLRAIDSLEAGVRRGDPDAIAKAAALARAIDGLLYARMLEVRR